jgi:hypothetical protein
MRDVMRDGDGNSKEGVLRISVLVTSSPHNGDVHSAFIPHFLDSLLVGRGEYFVGCAVDSWMVDRGWRGGDGRTRGECILIKGEVFSFSRNVVVSPHHRNGGSSFGLHLAFVGTLASASRSHLPNGSGTRENDRRRRGNGSI